MTAGALGLDLLVGAATVLAAIVAARLAHSAGLPALLVFLGLGLALGESGIGIRFDNADLTETLGLGALVLILAEGGLTTNWEHARRAAPAAVRAGHRRRRRQHRRGRRVHALAARPRLAGGPAARRRPRADRRGRRLLRAAQAAAARRCLSGMLEGESGLNDPPSVLAVTLLSQHGDARDCRRCTITGEVAWQLAGGAAIGVAVGLLGLLFLRKVALPATGLYPVAVLALIVAGYGAADLARASGFLAVYAAAVLLGNARLPHGPATRGFAEGVGWLAQIGLFVMLGLLASPSRLPAADPARPGGRARSWC